MSSRGTVLRCPKCVPLGRVTRADGSQLTGWLPEALYVGYLVTRRYEGRMKPPRTCRNCGSTLQEVAGGVRPS